MEDKAKKELLLIAVLTPVLLVLFWKNVMVPRMKPPRVITTDRKNFRSLGPGASPETPQGKVWSPQERVDKIKEYRALEWQGNPFYQAGMPKPQPGGKPPEKRPPQFNLAGIVWDGTAPYAIIDDELYRAGDWVRDFRVIEIKEDHVIMERDGERITLNLFPSNY